MVDTAGHTSFHERPDPRSKLYWLDIDVIFNDIFRQQRMTPSNSVVRLPPASSQYSVLHGVGTVANALSVGDRAKTFVRFGVDLEAFMQTDESLAPSERPRSAKMIWNELDVRSPRLQIYVQTKMLRHLVELYVTKRVNTVTISMKIAIVRQITSDTGSDAELLPLLDKDGRLYFRRTQCELLSVQTSLVHDGAWSQSGKPP
jgi:hypothetical protein